jgi:hypothetical protein
MTQDELAQKSRDELIDLVLAQIGQITKLQADNEALQLKLEKGKKPPTNYHILMIRSNTVKSYDVTSA